MKTTKVFKSGNSQAVRLPKGFQLDCDEVEISKQGDVITIRSIKPTLAQAFHLLTELPTDCFDEKRVDPPPQKRDFFK